MFQEEEHAHLCLACNNLWRHDDGKVDKHHCPRCGKGPWLWKYEGESLAEMHVLEEFERVRAGRDPGPWMDEPGVAELCEAAFNVLEKKHLAQAANGQARA